MTKARKSDVSGALPVKSNAPRPPAVTGGHHYIYSWVKSKRLPSGRAFTKIRRELSLLREELLERYSRNGKIRPEAVILIDSTIEALGVQKLQGLYVRKAGIMRQDSLKVGDLQLHSILGKNWISYANVVRQNIIALQALNLDTDDEAVDLGRYIAEKYGPPAAGQGEDSQDKGETGLIDDKESKNGTQ